MNLFTRNIAFVAGLALLAVEARAQSTFNSGSNGSHGVMAITQNTTLDVPPDGIFHCTTISIANNVTLRFRKNALNTPVYLLATGDVLISGIIDVSGGNNSGAVPGEGGPGAFDGGYGGFGPTAPANRGGDGNGPGRGVNANQRYDGVYSAPYQQNSNVYGNVLILPMVGGSGGSGGTGNPGNGGGGGGGAILIASNTRITLSGGIRALGGVGSPGGGSGGAVRLVAPTGGGNGYIYTQAQAGGSAGRIRIDTEDFNAFRNYTMLGAVTRGTRMFALPGPLPRLHIVEAAGTQIPAPASAAVTVQLPANAPATQQVKIRGEGFTGNVPIQLVIVPEHTASVQYDLVLDSSANPPEVTAVVTLPTAEPVKIQAWVR